MANAYLERELGWRQRLRVGLHLLICDDCRRYVAQLRALVALLRRRPLEPVPETRVAEIVRTLALRTEPSGSADDRPLPPTA